MITSRMKLPHKMTYWLPTANNGTGGKTWASPVTVDARVADVDKIVNTPEGKQHHATKVFYSKTTLPLGAYVVQGETTASTPSSEAKEVRMSNLNSSMTDLKLATV
jgi:hypothetical protein